MVLHLHFFENFLGRKEKSKASQSKSSCWAVFIISDVSDSLSDDSLAEGESIVVSVAGLGDWMKRSRSGDGDWFSLLFFESSLLLVAAAFESCSTVDSSEWLDRGDSSGEEREQESFDLFFIMRGFVNSMLPPLLIVSCVLSPRSGKMKSKGRKEKRWDQMRWEFKKLTVLARF